MPDNHELRWQPLLEQWVVISAKTAERPWSGKTEASQANHQPEHDKSCFLCPSVTRANGKVNPDYRGTWAFDNDFASLSGADPTPIACPDNPLHANAPAGGLCRVLCWSEKHNTSLSELASSSMRNVVQMWRDEYHQISRQSHIAQVLIFENKGVEIGVSNLHPHGQIYATTFVTDSGMRMRSSQARYLKTHNQPLMQALLEQPEYDGSLLVEQGKYFKTIVPYAARFAFETWLVPLRHVSAIDELTGEELGELATMYQRQIKRYDILFKRQSPNITLLHNAPCDEHKDNQACCFHISMQPPLRDPEKLKYLAGFESGSNNIVNPIQPENAASALKSIVPEDTTQDVVESAAGDTN